MVALLFGLTSPGPATGFGAIVGDQNVVITLDDSLLRECTNTDLSE